MEYILEDGRRFAWSESNVRYEEVPEDGASFTLLRFRLSVAEEKVERGRALLMEMHGTTGCDPTCAARYHEMFPPLTMEKFEEAVGPLRGTWPDGTPA